MLRVDVMVLMIVAARVLVVLVEAHIIATAAAAMRRLKPVVVVMLLWFLGCSMLEVMRLLRLLMVPLWLMGSPMQAAAGRRGVVHRFRVLEGRSWLVMMVIVLLQLRLMLFGMLVFGHVDLVVVFDGRRIMVVRVVVRQHLVVLLVGVVLDDQSVAVVFLRFRVHLLKS